MSRIRRFHVILRHSILKMTERYTHPGVPIVINARTDVYLKKIGEPEPASRHLFVIHGGLNFTL